MKNKILISYFASAIFSIGLCAEEQQAYKAAYTPWYTGTLNATSASNAPPGKLVIQPYFSYIYRYGTYNGNWKMEPLQHKEHGFVPALFLEWGLTDRIDFNIEPAMVTSYQAGQSETLITDLYTAVGFQILREILGTWVPNFRIVFQVTFPTGKFDMGQISRLATDFSGVGAFQIGGVFAVTKSFYTFPNHPFRISSNLGLSGFTDVDIRGLSVFGGDPYTIGTMNVAPRFFMYLTGELSLTQRWVLALETYFQYKARNRFKGVNIFIPLDPKETFAFQITPELEYNWSDNLGIIGGINWQFLGYNQNAFTGLTVSLVYTY